MDSCDLMQDSLCHTLLTRFVFLAKPPGFMPLVLADTGVNSLGPGRAKDAVLQLAAHALVKRDEEESEAKIKFTITCMSLDLALFTL
jgi:hypothetical protein